MDDISVRKFLFSRTQLEDKKEQAKAMDMEYVPGMVIVNGKEQQFTEMLLPSKSSRYQDARELIRGSIREIHFTPETRR